MRIGFRRYVVQIARSSTEDGEVKINASVENVNLHVLTRWLHVPIVQPVWHLGKIKDTVVHGGQFFWGCVNGQIPRGVRLGSYREERRTRIIVVHWRQGHSWREDLSALIQKVGFVIHVDVGRSPEVRLDECHIHVSADSR